MGIRNDMLPLGSHNGRFKNLGKNIREFTTKINSNGTDALGCQLFLQLVFIRPGFRQGHAHSGSCHISALKFPLHISIPCS